MRTFDRFDIFGHLSFLYLFKPSPFGVNGATDCYQFHTAKTPVFSIDEAIYE